MYNRKTVFWIACAGMLLFGICLITLGAVTPDLKSKFNLDNVSAGTLFSILPLGVLAGSLLFGPVCDKYGYRILLTVSALLLCVGFEGIAFSPTEGILKLYILLIGIGGGTINGATNALVADISEKDKGANLNLLGVFFGLGALGMPLLLGALERFMKFEAVIAIVGGATLIVAILFAVIKYPPAKQEEKLPLKTIISLFRDSFIMLIAFFLFFQSAFEALVNNWTTTFLIDRNGIVLSKALFALSSYVAGMSVMRLLIGSALRSLHAKKLLLLSFIITFIALACIKLGNAYIFSVAGLFILGMGLAGNFPTMLGLVGDKYSNISGTAFSIVFSIALLGNMLINYLMGNIAKVFGIQHLITVAFIEWIILIIMSMLVFRKYKTNN